MGTPLTSSPGPDADGLPDLPAVGADPDTVTVVGADPDTVTVVGAGIAGAACAAALREAGVSVRVVDRARAPGGRMASPTLHDRPVDIGAGYFTVRDDEFAGVVNRWQQSGLAREWTDTFAVLSATEAPTTTTGPMRWSTPHGLRSLVRELLEDVDVVLNNELTSVPDGAVVLAMPDPQAQRVAPLPDVRFIDYDPVIAVVAGYADRRWDFDAAFVHDHPELEFVADDGTRRGDRAPVLVAHTNAAFARAHLDEPDGAIAPVVRALSELLGIGEPAWTAAHRWTFAKPTASHDATFWLSTGSGPGSPPLGLAGDQWCVTGSPRVESAWRSGTDLGRALAAHLS